MINTLEKATNMEPVEQQPQTIASQQYWIDDILFDPEQGTVCKNGQSQSLPGLSLSVLQELVKHAPCVVTQQHLIDTVWNGLVVSDENLQQRIKLVRKALGDNSQDPKYIATVRGKGYQLIAAVTAVDEDNTDTQPASGTSLKQRWLMLTELPLYPIGRWIVPLLAIIGIYSAVQWQNSVADKPLVSTVFNQNPETESTKNTRSSIPRHWQQSPAYDLYSRGLYYYKQYHQAANDNAIQLFRQAIARDPDFIYAYAGLANALLQGVYQFNMKEKRLLEAHQLLEQAMRIDPNVAEVYKAQGLAYAMRGWFHQAIASYHQAARLNPNLLDAITNLAFTYREAGKLNEALYWHERAIKMAPEMAGGFQHLAQTYAVLTMDQQAQHYFDKTLTLRPDYQLARLYYCRFLLERGDYQHAFEQAEHIIQSSPRYYPAHNVAADTLYLRGDLEKAKSMYLQAEQQSQGRIRRYASYRLGLLLQQMGDFEPSLQRLNQSLDYLQQRVAKRDEDPEVAYRLATIYAVLDQPGTALKWLQKATEQGWVRYRKTQAEPALTSLKNQPKYLSLITQMQDKVAQMKQQAQANQDSLNH